jgi:hypothetical protein
MQPINPTKAKGLVGLAGFEILVGLEAERMPPSHKSDVLTILPNIIYSCHLPTLCMQLMIDVLESRSLQSCDIANK